MNEGVRLSDMESRKVKNRKLIQKQRKEEQARLVRVSRGFHTFSIFDRENHALELEMVTNYLCYDSDWEPLTLKDSLRWKEGCARNIRFYNLASQASYEILFEFVVYNERGGFGDHIIQNVILHLSRYGNCRSVQMLYGVIGEVFLRTVEGGWVIFFRKYIKGNYAKNTDLAFIPNEYAVRWLHKRQLQRRIVGKTIERWRHSLWIPPDGRLAKRYVSASLD